MKTDALVRRVRQWSIPALQGEPFCWFWGGPVEAEIYDQTQWQMFDVLNRVEYDLNLKGYTW